MSVGITLQELLAWNRESSRFWNDHLDANPHLLVLPATLAEPPTCRSLFATSGALSCAGVSGWQALPKRRKKISRQARWMRSLPCTRRPMRFFAICLLPRTKAGSKPTCSMLVGCRRSNGPCRGAKLLSTRSSTANVIGRNWPRWCARQGSPRGSREIFFSAAAVR